MYFLRSIWKNLHLTEFFTRAAPVVPVTNMRYALTQQEPKLSSSIPQWHCIDCGQHHAASAVAMWHGWVKISKNGLPRPLEFLASLRSFKKQGHLYNNRKSVGCQMILSSIKWVERSDTYNPEMEAKLIFSFESSRPNNEFLVWAWEERQAQKAKAGAQKEKWGGGWGLRPLPFPSVYSSCHHVLLWNIFDEKIPNILLQHFQIVLL